MKKKTMKKAIQRKQRKYAVATLDLMRAIKLREQIKGAKVSTSGEVFAILRAMGYKRKDRTGIQEGAREFADCVRQTLIRSKRTSPSYDEVLGAMKTLGYKRELAA